ncbi:tetratricopeptide repeat protein, partial [Klebsiella pneumoniae]|uniref:tetratricopeptide repeat protein n=1 Tax=Klebsiella pneumoniae TaxID=573 RepID=UPI003EE1972B
MGDQSPSLPWLEEALEIRRRIADEEGEAVVLNMIGIYHKDDERLELAESFFEQSLAIRRRLDLRSGIGSSLTNLGSLRRQMGDP